MDVTITDDEIGTIEHEGNNVPIPAKRDLSHVKRRTSEYGFVIDSPLNGFCESSMTVSFDSILTAACHGRNFWSHHSNFRGLHVTCVAPRPGDFAISHNSRPHFAVSHTNQPETC